MALPLVPILYFLHYGLNEFTVNGCMESPVVSPSTSYLDTRQTNYFTLRNTTHVSTTSANPKSSRTYENRHNLVIHAATTINSFLLSHHTTIRSSQQAHCPTPSYQYQLTILDLTSTSLPEQNLQSKNLLLDSSVTTPGPILSATRSREVARG